MNRLLPVCVLVCAFVPFGTSAQVLISEIMYDLEEGSDSGREWIEVFNAYANSIILTDFRLYENDTNHKINEFSGGVSLDSGKYAVIADNPAKFLEDWPNYSGLLFDSAFSLKNTGEALSIRDSDLVDIDAISFISEDGAAGDGNTLQRMSSDNTKLVAGSPSPGSGALGIIGGSYGNGADSDSTQSSEQQSQGNVVTYEQPEPQVYAYLGGDRDVIVGADVLFKGRALDKDGNPIGRTARYIWNFGDGEIAEGESVVHVWKYPGRYVMVLDVAYNKFAASDRIIVTAHAANVAIAAHKNGDVEITNNGVRDLDLSFWHLASLGLHFTIPENTFLLAGEKVRFLQAVTHLPPSDDVMLLYPNGEVAYESGMSEDVSVNNNEGKGAKSTRDVVPDQKVILTQDPTAEPVVVVGKNEEKESSQVASAAAAIDSGWDFMPQITWIVGLVFLVGIGALGAMAARAASRKEYTIIEEE